MTAGAQAPALELSGVIKRFGALRALDGARLRIDAGRIHALLGENGAGKTTLMRVAFGMEDADGGVIRVDGAEVRLRSSADAIHLGIGMVQQHFLLIPALTVAENVALGESSRASALARFDPSRARERVRRLGEQTGLVLDPDARASELPVGAQQRLELLRAMARQPRVLILDEPTAVLTADETRELYTWLRGFAEAGGAVVLITHKVREALALADDVTILRRGVAVWSGPANTLSEDDAVTAMVGATAAAPEQHAPRPQRTKAEVVVSLANVTAVDATGVSRLRNVSIDVFAGEVLGIIGVEGSGQRELVRLLAGRLQPSSGAVQLPDVVAFVPEDRLHDAVIPDWSLIDNTMLAGAGRMRGRLPFAAGRSRTRRILLDFEIHNSDPTLTLRSLSGGNQQRFVLGRELLLGARALVVENPTRGLDVRAARRLISAVEHAARVDGVAVVFSSSDTEEVLAVADRVVACFAGSVRTLGDRSAAAAARALVGLS